MNAFYAFMVGPVNLSSVGIERVFFNRLKTEKDLYVLQVPCNQLTIANLQALNHNGQGRGGGGGGGGGFYIRYYIVTSFLCGI